MMDDRKSAITRIFGSLLGAFFVTTSLFLLMVVLISTQFIPPQNHELKQFTEHNESITISTRPKRILKPKLKKATALPPAPALNSFHVKIKPVENSQNPEIRKITSPSKPHFQSNFTASLPNHRLNIDLRTYPGHHSGRGAGTNGNGTKHGGLNQCTIAFTLLPNNDIENVFWQNCIDSNIANKAEEELYAWIARRDESFIRLNAKSGDTLEFTFEQR